MDKLRMQTLDGVQDNIDKIAALFPNCITERKDAEGKVTLAIDFDKLRQELSSEIVEGREERYQFTWPDKKKAILLANSPINATLRPCREESVDFDNTQNLYIEGDNLDVLKCLKETYLGKVKMIYIDPPYNTGNDFVYEDDFAESTSEYLANSGQYDEQGNRLVNNTESNGRFHTDWLNMIYPRLKVAKDLLTGDGVIFISIDEHEVENLRKICDEVFGESNFAGEIIWKNSSKNDQAYISIQHEYIICYVKNKTLNSGSWIEEKEGIDQIFKAFEDFRQKYGDNWGQIHKAALEWYKQFPESNPIYNSKHYSWMDEKGVYFPDNISGPNFGQYRYDVIHPITGRVVKEPASGWRYPETTMIQRISDNLVHFGVDETTVPNNKTYLANTRTQSLTSIKYRDGRVASKMLTQLMGLNVFNNPKDISILTLLFKAIGLKTGDIVLDFFSGSASTAHAIFDYNNKKNVEVKFIMVQIQEDLDEALKKATGGGKTILQNAIRLCDVHSWPHILTELGKERIRRAGKKIKEELASKQQENGLFTEQEGKQTLDIGFRVLKLDSSNMQDIYYSPTEYNQNDLFSKTESVKSDRTSEDLLFQVMLELGATLDSKIEQIEIKGKTIYNVATNYLVACFDNEIDDSVVTAIAKMQPQYAVFRDSSMADDSTATNFEQIFKTYSPNTTTKVL